MLSLDNALAALGGGALIGLSATLLYLTSGRVAGISGVLSGFLSAPTEGFRPWFLGGLVLAGIGIRSVSPSVLPLHDASSLYVMVPAGLLVGFGTRLSGGCTSGHGVCGMARLSRRSLVATSIFMATAGITVYLTHHLGGR